MKVSIIPSDGIVYLDGVGYEVADAKKLADRIQAVQWDGTEGHIEYVQPKGEYFPNEKMVDITPFQPLIRKALEQVTNPPPAPEVPLEMFAYRTRQQIAFSQAKTKDFGVQYSDPLSIGLMTALVALLDKGALTGPINYKGPNGFISLSAEQMTQLSFQVAAHVQKAFNAEKSILEDIEMGTIKTHEQITAAFAAAMSAK